MARGRRSEQTQSLSGCVCYETRGQSEAGGRGGSQGAARPQQGLDDKIWEVRGRKAGAMTGGSCGNKDSEAVTKGRLNDPGMGVHVYQK